MTRSMARKKAQEEKERSVKHWDIIVTKSAKQMANMPVIRDEKLHEDEKETNGDPWGLNLLENPYEEASNTDEVKYKELCDGLSKSFSEENKDDIVDDDKVIFNEKDDLFDDRVYEKFTAILTSNNLKTPDNFKPKEPTYKRKTCRLFSAFRNKIASREFDSMRNKVDKLCDGLFLKAKYGITNVPLINGWDHSEPEQAPALLVLNDFYTFKSVWQHLINVIEKRWYDFIVKILPNDTYYGYADLEDMIASTGGFKQGDLSEYDDAVKKINLIKKIESMKPNRSIIPDINEEEISKLLMEQAKKVVTEMKSDDKTEATE